MKRCRALVAFVELHHLPCATSADKELALLTYLDELFIQGKEVPEGTKMWAAFCHPYPQHGRVGAEPLPRVLRALQGWSKLAPAGFRLPLPEEAVAAIALMMLKQGEPAWGLLTLIGMSAYLRPGELAP